MKHFEPILALSILPLFVSSQPWDVKVVGSQTYESVFLDRIQNDSLYFSFRKRFSLRTDYLSLPVESILHLTNNWEQKSRWIGMIGGSILGGFGGYRFGNSIIYCPEKEGSGGLFGGGGGKLSRDCKRLDYLVTFVGMNVGVGIGMFLGGLVVAGLGTTDQEMIFYDLSNMGRDEKIDLIKKILESQKR